MSIRSSPESKLLRVPEAAAALGLCRTSVYELINEGELPIVRLGGATRIEASEVIALIRRKTLRRGGQNATG